ncbi:MAG TPA: TOMM system kinase/cyclase fusion protein, partial [Polyangiaceae bacterium]|nr:TOMM system kinase/cyclase fusion protein [Polyangiaceae bacterium]
MASEIPEFQALWGEAYDIVQRLGRGGYATVFKAVQRATGQTVAIKVQRLDPDQTAEERAARVARFERETRLCQTLTHPNIVRMIESGQSDRFLYIVFEFVPGETLSQLLIRRGALLAEESCWLMADVLEALAGAHSQGILHRDLKPDNIMVESRADQLLIRVLDFGVGAFVPGTIEGAATLTRSHEILGTPCYAAPEQLRGEPATTRSDIYAWGLVFLECLTGQRVIDGATMAQVFQKQLSPLEVPLPPALAAHPLAALLRRALAKSPNERAGDAARLAAELRKVPIGDLVGLLTPHFNDRPARTLALDARKPVAEQRHVTALSFSLTVSAVAQDGRELGLDLETLDAVQRDQMSLCIDLVRRFGGHVAGTLANRMLAVFGYPEAMSGDARRAGRAALEISSRLQVRRRLLASQRGIELEFRMGLHTGSVIVDPSGHAAGPALNLASRLEGMAEAQTTLVTEATRQLLEPYLRFRPVHLDIPSRIYALVSEKASATLDVQQTGSDRGPIIGRGAELEALNALLAQARAGSGALTLIRGEPGIGKSRLVQEVCRRALETGVGVLDGQCLLEDKNSALSPVLSLVRRYFELDEGLKEGLARIEELLPAARAREITSILCAWLELAKPDGYPDPNLSAEAQRKLLLEALVRILSHASRSDAQLVVIEDVQWADPTTLELLRTLAREVKAQRTLVLLTARPEFTACPEEGSLIELSGLSPSDVERLLNERLGDLRLSRETRARIVERTDGVPLFLDELSRSLLRAAQATEPSAEPDSSPLRQPNIPDSLRDLLSSRLDGLGQGKETAQLASAIGREFELELLSAISLRGTETLQGDLDSLVQSELVLRRATQDGARYVFRHALIQEAAWDSMLPSQRRSVHRSIAQVLETKFADQAKQEPARLARHYELGHVPEKAVALRLQSAQQAARSLAYLESVAHARAGLALLPYVEDTALANTWDLELNNILGGMLSAAQGFAAPELIEAFTRCQTLLQTTEPPPLQRLMTQKGLWTFHNARADYSSASLLVAQMLSLAAAHPEPIFKLGAHT